MENNFGLPKRTIDEVLNYFGKNPNIELVKIYGSRAKGNYKRGSDIDFAIWIKEPDSILKILDDLDELETPYKFDVVNYYTLKHEGMIDSINKEGIIFYKKEAV